MDNNLVKHDLSESSDPVSNPFASFANGLIRSFENSYNGAAQLTTSISNGESKVSKRVDTSSKLAQAADSVGEIVGVGVQLLTINKMMPAAKSLVGHAVVGTASGAIYGGLLQRSEGHDLRSERFKNALSMGILSGSMSLAQVGTFALGLKNQSIGHIAGRGTISGALAGASHEVLNAFLNDRTLTMSGLGQAVGKGALLGLSMEAGASALIKTNFSRRPDLYTRPVDFTDLELLQLKKLQKILKGVKPSDVTPTGPFGRPHRYADNITSDTIDVI